MSDGWYEYQSRVHVDQSIAEQCEKIMQPVLDAQEKWIANLAMIIEKDKP